MGRKRRRGARARRYPDLATYLAESGETQLALARRIGMSQGYLSHVAAGHFVPRAERQMLIAAACRIPMSSFTRTYLLRRGAA